VSCFEAQSPLGFWAFAFGLAPGLTILEFVFRFFPLPGFNLSSSTARFFIRGPERGALRRFLPRAALMRGLFGERRKSETEQAEQKKKYYENKQQQKFGDQTQEPNRTIEQTAD
jgi:hypothetical protein